MWSIGLQKKISFCEDVVVEVKHTYLNQIYFGMIIDHSDFGPDYETDNEIEFGSDAVDSEYVKKNKGNLTDYFYEYENISSRRRQERIGEDIGQRHPMVS